MLSLHRGVQICDHAESSELLAMIIAATLSDALLHLMMPAAVLGASGTASLMRFTRSSMLEVLRQDYVVTARSKGLSERLIIVRHAFRNGLLPIITVVSLQLPGLFGGSLIIAQ